MTGLFDIEGFGCSVIPLAALLVLNNLLSAVIWHIQCLSIKFLHIDTI
jgi:hypothetical protein